MPELTSDELNRAIAEARNEIEIDYMRTDDGEMRVDTVPDYLLWQHAGVLLEEMTQADDVWAVHVFWTSRWEVHVSIRPAELAPIICWGDTLTEAACRAWARWKGIG